MSVGELIVYIVIAALCGLVGQILAGNTVGMGGLAISTVVGLIGAILGAYVQRSINAPEPFPVTIGDRSLPVLWTIIGAALVTILVTGIQRAMARR